MKFRMVDRILEWQPQRCIRGVKNVSFEEYNLPPLFGHQPALPHSLLLEALFQLGNWLIVLSSEFQCMGLVVRTQQVRFHDLLRPGESLHMAITVRSYRPDGVLFDGQAQTDGRLIADGTGCLATPTALDHYCDPEELRAYFAQIHQPEHAELGA